MTLLSGVLLSVTPLTISGSVSAADQVASTQAASSSSIDVSGIRKMNVATVNAIRKSNGLSSLSENGKIDSYAQQRANHYAKLGKIDSNHAGFDPNKYAPYNSVAGENLDVVTTSSTGRKAMTTISNTAVKDWWNDSGQANYGHRKTMLSSYHNQIGVGVAKISGTNNYVVVQDYGLDSSTASALYKKDPNGYMNYPKKEQANGLGAWAKYKWNGSTGLAK